MSAMEARVVLQHAAQHARVFIRACGWCEEIAEIREPRESTPGVSHGICPRCLAEQMNGGNHAA